MLTDLLFLYVECLDQLTTLDVSYNLLERAEDIEHLTRCRSISVLNLANNKLGSSAIVEVSHPNQTKMRAILKVCTIQLSYTGTFDTYELLCFT
jgi:hypothetical protein